MKKRYPVQEFKSAKTITEIRAAIAAFKLAAAQDINMFIFRLELAAIAIFLRVRRRIRRIRQSS